MKAQVHLGKALELDPDNVEAKLQRAYTFLWRGEKDRARLNHYLGQLDLAWLEVDKGLTLEPKHSLLRTTKGYLFFSEQAYEKAIPVLESVIEEDPNRRVTYPTLAMCYVRNNQPHKAHSLITDELLTIAATDCEMTFRLASYFAVDGNHIEALHWLRKAIYLGYENYPWIKENPIWKPLHNNEEFIELLSDLERVFDTNKSRWKKFLNDFWEET
jgi:serine/threonine-protein kinase